MRKALGHFWTEAGDEYEAGKSGDASEAGVEVLGVRK
jgi:hypothetical protein